MSDNKPKKNTNKNVNKDPTHFKQKVAEIPIFNKENLISEIFKILGYILGGYGLTFLIPRKK